MKYANPFKQGEFDYMHGVELDGGPYKRGTQHEAEWVDGWMAAQHEYNETRAHFNAINGVVPY